MLMKPEDILALKTLMGKQLAEIEAMYLKFEKVSKRLHASSSNTPFSELTELEQKVMLSIINIREQYKDIYSYYMEGIMIINKLTETTESEVIKPADTDFKGNQDNIFKTVGDAFEQKLKSTDQKHKLFMDKEDHITGGKINMESKPTRNTIVRKSIINLADYNLDRKLFTDIIIPQLNCAGEQGFPPYVSFINEEFMKTCRSDGQYGLMQYCQVSADRIIGLVREIYMGSPGTDIMIVNYEIDLNSMCLICSDPYDNVRTLLSKRPGDFTLKPRMAGNKFICFDLIPTGVYSTYTLLQSETEVEKEKEKEVERGIEHE